MKYRMIIMLMLLTGLVAQAPASDRFVERISGGPEVIYEPHAGAGVVCVAVAIEAGSVFETPATRGVSHLLEHMVFNGTERYSREEISGWIDDVGGFLNAFTRKETTVYFLLVRRELLEQGIEILSQMLLHSVFPPDELTKERNVVLEELRKTMDNPVEARSRLVDRYLYRGSTLTEPVLGVPATVEGISREELIAYYRERYHPSNMRVYIIGGFDSARTRGWLDDYFRRPGAPPPEMPRHAEERVPRWSGEITVRVSDRLEEGFDIVVPMPRVIERDFAAAVVTAKVLGGAGSPLTAALDSLTLPEPEIGLEVHRYFSCLRLHIGPSDRGADTYRHLPAILEELADWDPSPKLVEAARVSLLSADAFDREKYHFYIMSAGERIALFGNAYLSAAIHGVASVRAEDCGRLLRKRLRPLRFNACLVQRGSAVPSGTGGVAPPHTKVLPNGCTVVVERRPESSVAALGILIRSRACIEETRGMGFAAVLHAFLEHSAAGDSLTRRLDLLGARIQWADNPYIPFDDYLVSPSHAFIRLEAPAPRIGEAASLLVGHLTDSEIGRGDTDPVLAKLRMEIGIRTASPRTELRRSMYRELFGTHPYGRPILPGMSELGRITPDRLEEFRAEYVRGGNIIASLVSPLEPVEALRLLARTFATITDGSSPPCPPAPQREGGRVVDGSTGGAGAYLAAGWVLTCAGEREAAAALVAGEVLSRRMQLEIRERMGLAYSTGCRVAMLPGRAVAIASVGTRAANLEQAQSALGEEIGGLGGDPPTEHEISTAISRILGGWDRRELSSINRAHALGLGYHLFGETGSRLAAFVGTVTADDLDIVVDRMSVDQAVIVRLLPEAGTR